MASSKLDEMEKAYREAGFQTERKSDGRLSFSKKTELVIGRKGGERAASRDVGPGSASARCKKGLKT